MNANLLRLALSQVKVELFQVGLTSVWLDRTYSGSSIQLESDRKIADDLSAQETGHAWAHGLEVAAFPFRLGSEVISWYDLGIIAVRF